VPVALNLSPALTRHLGADARLQNGAYITDGEELYCVERAAFTPTSLRPNLLVVEDCRTNAKLELDVLRVTTTCTLVRPDPGA
jgi:hypothetical protein